MKVKILSCWFTTSYGTYTGGLRKALERQLGHEVGIIASNCGCGDPMEVQRRFVDDRCEFVEFANLPYYKMSNALKQWALVQGRQLVYRERARRYLKLSGDADVLHFQQILNAFGSVAVFNWLQMHSRAARVVTVHELDPYQQEHPELALQYNRADAVIVHTEQMRAELAKLGVEGDRIDVVAHGVDVGPFPQGVRSGVVFYLGHKLNAAKGLITLLTGMALVRDKLGAATPRLTIHSHMGQSTPERGAEAVREVGLEGQVSWANELSHADATALYQRSALCVLPYKGSFAGYPATLAMANGAVVIGTRTAGLPEHLGDTGVWIDTDDPAALAATVLRLLEDEGERRRIAVRARARAETDLSWDAVAGKTLATYRKAMQRKQQVRAAGEARAQE
jgi:glycosyltransferase involved in cell wall biosynthesis